MSGAVPNMLDTLPFVMAIEIAWKRKYFDRFSPVASAILDPMSFMNFSPIGPHDPMVSVATGMTVSTSSASKMFGFHAA